MQPVKVIIDYVAVLPYGTYDGFAAPLAATFNRGEAEVGTTIDWATEGPDNTYPEYHGGIQSINSVRVYGQDSSGNYTVLLRSTK